VIHNPDCSLSFRKGGEIVNRRDFLVIPVLVVSFSIVFTCSNSDTAVTRVKNSSSTEITESDTRYVDQNEIAVPEEREGNFIGEQPVAETGDKEREGDEDWEDGEEREEWYEKRVRIDNVYEYIDYYFQLVAETVVYTEYECKEMEGVDSTGETVFKARLTGNCHLKIEIETDEIDIDTTLNICAN
jgi:hypothetical protein